MFSIVFYLGTSIQYLELHRLSFGMLIPLMASLFRYFDSIFGFMLASPWSWGMVALRQFWSAASSPRRLRSSWAPRSRWGGPRMVPPNRRRQPTGRPLRDSCGHRRPVDIRLRGAPMSRGGWARRLSRHGVILRPRRQPKRRLDVSAAQFNLDLFAESPSAHRFHLRLPPTLLPALGSMHPLPPCRLGRVLSTG